MAVDERSRLNKLFHLLFVETGTTAHSNCLKIEYSFEFDHLFKVPRVTENETNPQSSAWKMIN